MVKKLGLISSLFSNNKDTPPPPPPPPPPSSWPWLNISCNPKTNSFRDTDTITIPTTCLNNASTYIDSTESCFTHSSTLTESESLSLSASYSEPSTPDHVEYVIHAVKSDRLFYEPIPTSSILEDRNKSTRNGDPGKLEECAVALELESEDPYSDFVESMVEMVTANGMKDWDFLEQMLGWYLKINPESAHGYIIDAFVDVLLGLTCSSDSGSCDCSSSTSSSASYNRFDNCDHEEHKRKDLCLSCEITEVEEIN